MSDSGLPYFREIPLCTQKSLKNMVFNHKDSFSELGRTGKYPKYVELSYLHSSKTLVQKRALQFIIGLCHMFPAISSCIFYNVVLCVKYLQCLQIKLWRAWKI